MVAELLVQMRSKSENTEGAEIMRKRSKELPNHRTKSSTNGGIVRESAVRGGPRTLAFGGVETEEHLGVVVGV